MPHATAATISTGDEIVLGQTLDTNAQWLAGALLRAGVLPVGHATVGDDPRALAAALRDSASRADVVVVTGGLGPTADDVTREALAAVLGEPQVEDAAALGQVRGYFARLGRAMPEINRVQAMRPASAAFLPNPHGTAPGLAASLPRAAAEPALCFCLPGPPGEMRAMFEREVRPRLRPPERVVATRALHCIGIGESDVAQRLGPLMDRGRNPLIGTTASGGVISCRIRFEGRRADAPAAVEAAERAVRHAVGPFVFGVDEESLASAVLDLLRAPARTLATVESCTGGLLGRMITEVPGSSDVYLGGWITYANAMKTGEVGVPAGVLSGPGAVSRECALAMAAGGLRESGADHALSITGIAGPEGGSAEKPVGTVWIGAATRDGPAEARRFLFGGDRAAIRHLSAVSALAWLRLRVLGVEGRLLRQVEP